MDTCNDEGDEGRSKHKKCYCRRLAANADESCRNEIPLEILLDHIAPFLDRGTYNSCLLLCRKARRILKASWWKTKRSLVVSSLPPWPRKLVSRDPSCRVRCLTFSEDNALLACGCSDGKIRSWDVRVGELQMPCEGHWPDEAVVALAYGHDSDHRLLASSSTDGTIRVWEIHSNPAAEDYPIPNTTKDTTRITTTTTTLTTSMRGKTLAGTNPSSIASSCILCVPADHVVSLHFSPDDSYLVSGHLRMRNADDLLPTSTIEIREVRTGHRLRRFEGGGVPVGFLPSAPKRPRQLLRHRFHASTLEDRDEIVADEVEHRLLSTCGPNTCLKLWSWNRTRYVTSYDENENENENHNPNIPSYPISNINGISDENEQQTIAVPFPTHADYKSKDMIRREQYKTVLDSGRCIKQLFLDRFNTVLPVPATTRRTNSYKHNSDKSETTEPNGNNDKSSDEGACEILVAVINEPSNNSFAVWKTSSPQDRKVFRNTSPYEIRFSPDGSKIASVDDFNTVKVWRISDGVLLKTFSGGGDEGENRSKYSNTARCCDCKIPVNYGSNNIQYEGEEDSDETSVSYVDDDDGANNGDGLFPIHELVFSKDSSTVAVISRCYNEVHLFST